MAKKRAAKAAKTRRISASQGLQDAPVKLPPSGAIRFNDAAGWALIFCAAFIAYFPALNGTLLWDDNHHITRPDLTLFHGLWRIWSDVHATWQYYPLLHSAFWLEHMVWGDAVLGYHLINIALHAFSACLVVSIMRRLSLPGAWLAGFVFALHPVNVEAVAWISEQKSALSGVFCLASLLVYLHFDRDRRKSQYLFATLLFVLALLSKTVTATLPAVLLVVFWWQRGRLGWKRDVLPLVPWFALGISAGLFTAWIEKTVIGAEGPDFLLTPVQRFLIASRVIWFYASKLFWPANLTFSYPHWNVDPAIWWQWIFPVGVLAVGIGLALFARSHRGPLAGFLIFSGTLFPVLGFLNVYPFRYSYVADHYQYLASLGIIVPVCAILAKAAEQTSPGKNAIIAGFAALILIPGVLTWRQSRSYTDSETLYRATLARNPTSWFAYNNLGTLLAETPERVPEAVADYQAALRNKPDYPEAHNNLGSLLAQIPGRTPGAIAEFQEALQYRPNYYEAYYNLGSTLEQIPGRAPEAIKDFQTAAQLRPGSVEAHYNLAILLAQTPGRLSDAIAEYRAALDINPDFAEAHNNLGSLLAQIPGQMPEAVTEFRAVLRISPDSVEAHYNLGNALAQIPAQIPEAISEFQTVLRIRPDFAQAHYKLGILLAQTPGQLPNAIAEFQEALRIKPDYAEARDDLQNAMAQIQTPESR